ncbi:BnaC05g26260D [Brassica napus]|uniref:BnaC05g26260D protein n=1 Tax=Brassica napus TaxID=3708 RepID=A0A078G5X2_BRANA|nr:BnaC05g26260D [Brassica napus]
MVLRLVSSNQMQFDSSCYIEVQDMFIGLVYLHLVSLNQVQVAVGWGGMKRVYVSKFDCRHFIMTWDSGLRWIRGIRRCYEYLKMLQGKLYFSMVWRLCILRFLRCLGIIKSASAGSIKHNQVIIK